MQSFLRQPTNRITGSCRHLGVSKQCSRPDVPTVAVPHAPADVCRPQGLAVLLLVRAHSCLTVVAVVIPIFIIILFCCRFAFPALKLPAPVQLQHSSPLIDTVGIDAAASVADACAAMLQQATTQPPVALLTICAGSAQLLPLSQLHQHADALRDSQAPPCSAAAASNVMIVIADAQYESEHPAWPLRNVLAMLTAHVGSCTLRVLCLRGDLRGVDVNRCRVLSLDLPALPGTYS